MLRTQTTGRTRRRCALTWRGTTIRTVSTLWHVIIVLWDEQRSGPRVYCSSSASPRSPQAAQPAHKPHAHVSHTWLCVYAESLSNRWARLPAVLAASSPPPNKRMLTRHSTAGCWDMMCDMMSHSYIHLLTMYSARDSPYKLPNLERPRRLCLWLVFGWSWDKGTWDAISTIPKPSSGHCKCLPETTPGR